MTKFYPLYSYNVFKYFSFIYIRVLSIYQACVDSSD